jgi:prepilin-type N-terminal cleavage/methylation domain-containing protein
LVAKGLVASRCCREDVDVADVDGSLGVGRSNERGFTLLEVIISTTILVVVMGALVMSAILYFRGTNGMSDSLTESHDTQLVAARFVADVQSASSISAVPVADAALPSCPVTGDIAEFTWTNGVKTRASYAVVGSPAVLVRRLCTPTTTSTQTLGRLVGTPAPSVVLSCGSAVPTCDTDARTPAKAPISAVQVAGVTLKVTEQTINAVPYGFQLSGSPRIGSATGTPPPSSGPPVPLLLLAKSGIGFSMKGTNTLTVNGVAQINSGSPGAMEARGTINFASGATIAGSGTCTGNVCGSLSVTTGAPQIDDPLANLAPPSTACPCFSDGNYHGPGVYDTKAADFTSTPTVAPGVYVFKAGVKGNVNGSGVLLYVASGAADRLSATISPPTSGTYKDLALWIDKNNPQQTISDGISTPAGIVYGPNTTLTSNGNGTFVAKMLLIGNLDLGGTVSVVVG